MPETPRSTFRLPSQTLDQIDRIRRHFGGLTRTRAIALAVEALERNINRRTRSQDPTSKTRSRDQ